MSASDTTVASSTHRLNLHTLVVPLSSCPRRPACAAMISGWFLRLRIAGSESIYERPKTSRVDVGAGHRVLTYLLAGVSITRPNQVTASASALIGVPEGFNAGRGSQLTQYGLRKRAGGLRGGERHGWARPLDRRRVHRGILALAEVRELVAARVRGPHRSPSRNRSVDRLPQRPAARQLRSPHARRRVRWGRTGPSAHCPKRSRLRRPDPGGCRPSAPDQGG